MKTVAIIQARMNSERLPGKTLFQISGRPVLQYIIDRLIHCDGIAEIVVATSVMAENDAVDFYCIERKIACHRGPEEDVAKRFIEVIEKYGYESFVRVNGDSPLIDQRLISKGIKIFFNKNYDLVTNVFPRTYPKGQSVEVIKAESFKAAYSKMEEKDDKEHITRYFYSHSNEYEIFNFESGNYYGDIQLSVDTPRDMRVFENIIKKMDRSHWEYSYEDILRIYQNMTE